MKDKILLLGATGFLGRRLARRLRAENVEFVPVSRSLGTDLRDAAQCRQIFEKYGPFSAVMHAATFIGGIQFGLAHPAEICRDNCLMAVNLFEMAREFGVPRIVNPISNCSYPRDAYPEFREESWWDGPLDESVMAYGLVRKVSYVQSVAYFKQFGVETINLIVPNMYGPEDHFDEIRSHALGALVKKIVQAKIAGRPSVTVWGSGRPVREWLYVDDCAEAMFRALRVPHVVEPVNIGIGRGVSIAELAEAIRRQSGYSGTLQFDTSKPDGAPYKVMNIDRCAKIFGWTPATSLEEGLGKTIDWYVTKVAKQ